MPTQLEQAIERASNPKFWGSLVIQYQRGKPVIVRIEETIKLAEDNRYGNSSPQLLR
jgi:hypothetical protein